MPHGSEENAVSSNFDFDALPPHHQAAVRVFLHHLRLADFQGEQWDFVWPQVGGKFDSPIPMPKKLREQGVLSASNPQIPLSSPVSSPVSSPAHGTSETIRVELNEKAIPQNRLPADLSDCCSCRDALMVMFHHEQRRMSAGDARQWLADHGKEYKAKTVETVLTQLRTDGQLNNVKDGHGKGFGPAEWN